MDLAAKILDLNALPEWRESIRAQGRVLVVTNGCFDLLHAGHVTYLNAAREQGDLLLVGMNSDSSVRQLKGPDRPLNPQEDRLLVLAALAVVDKVCLFNDKRATRFLELAKPDVYVKGGDFSVEQLPAEEREVVEKNGGRIQTLSLVAGRSTTSLLDKIRGVRDGK